MPILLEISPQKATQEKRRIAFVKACAKNGDIQMMATDCLLPSSFTLSSRDYFPWKTFFLKLRAKWFLSAIEDIPPAFRLKKRIDEALLDEIEKRPEQDFPKIFATLRRAGFFGKLPLKL